MIQTILKKGKAIPEEVPAPVVSKGSILIRVVNSCISMGTETLGLQISGKSLIRRALDQPENLKKVIDMTRSEGVSAAYTKVMNKLQLGQPTGYSLSGIVIGLGEGITGFGIGDRVAAAGAGYANHAEFVNVPKNLVVKIPVGLDHLRASTVTLGAIAIQAIRRANLSLGEFAVVFGAGLLGQLCVQVLKASGVRVATIDLAPEKLENAIQLGAEITANPLKENPISKVINWSNGYGADAVIFSASTEESEPLSQAFQMCRKKGRLVLLGVSGMNIKRDDLYVKELDFLISTSYGPGRYDSHYEEKGLDYPYPYVRWTENRNMTEYLRLLSSDSVTLDKLTSKTFSIENSKEAFELLQATGKKPLLLFLDYGEPAINKLLEYENHDRKVFLTNNPIKDSRIRIALIGAGNFALDTHLPNIAKLSDKYTLHAVVNKTGHKGKFVAEKYNAKYATTDYQDILDDNDVDLVMIATRHDNHCELALKALKAGKNTFVEKPLAVNEVQLQELEAFFANSEAPPVLMAGFNRRFSQFAKELKKHTDKRINPLFLCYRMNAGYVPLDHWAHEHGGRIIGEACHIIDFTTFLTGCRIISISCEELNPQTEYFSSTDNKSIILKYEDGSVVAIQYFAVGNNKCRKEYIEVHFDGNSIVLDNYSSIRAYGIDLNHISTKLDPKGHLEELKALYTTLSTANSKWPIEYWELIQTTKACLFLV